MYQLVIVDDEDKIVEGIANLFPWEQLGFQVTWFSRPFKGIGIRKNPSGPCTYE